MRRIVSPRRSLGTRIERVVRAHQPVAARPRIAMPLLLPRCGGGDRLDRDGLRVGGEVAVGQQPEAGGEELGERVEQRDHDRAAPGSRSAAPRTPARRRASRRAGCWRRPCPPVLRVAERVAEHQVGEEHRREREQRRERVAQRRRVDQQRLGRHAGRRSPSAMNSPA